MVDALRTVETLLTNNWLSANTDSITPLFQIIVEGEKVLNLGNDDYVLIYLADEGHEEYGIGGAEFHEEPLVSIDVRTTNKRGVIATVRPHLVKIKDEVLRIVRANISDPDADYKLLRTKRIKDLSDKSIGIGKYVIDVQLDRWVNI